MKAIRVMIPMITTAITTAIVVLVSVWLTGLVPTGEWSKFLEALIIIVVVGATLFIIAWSAYFTYVIREAIEKSLSGEMSDERAKK